MGKTYGNGLDINDMVSGFCSNPMEYAEASKLSLYSIADYTWNMPAYDPVASWERAMKDLMPVCHEAFRIFCENNVDIGYSGHGLRREEKVLTSIRLPKRAFRKALPVWYGLRTIFWRTRSTVRKCSLRSDLG